MKVVKNPLKKAQLVIATAKSTSNISFKLLTGINRPIKLKRVSALATSILDIGIQRPVVTIVTSLWDLVPTRYILDGQHLFHALMKLDCDIPYTTLYSEDKEEIIRWMAVLNNTSSTWTMDDFVNVWKVGDGREDYAELQKLRRTYNLAYATIAACYCNVRTENAGRIIKRGTFKIVNKERGDLILKNLVDIFKITRKNSSQFLTTKFLNLYILWRHVVPSYNHEAFLKYIKENNAEFIVIADVEEQTTALLQKFV